MSMVLGNKSSRSREGTNVRVNQMRLKYDRPNSGGEIKRIEARNEKIWVNIWVIYKLTIK